MTVTRIVRALNALYRCPNCGVLPCQTLNEYKCGGLGPSRSDFMSPTPFARSAVRASIAAESFHPSPGIGPMSQRTKNIWIEICPPAQTVTGRAAFRKLLSAEGITHYSATPGPPSCPLMEALSYHLQIDYVLGLRKPWWWRWPTATRAPQPARRRQSARRPGLGNAIGALYNAKILRLAADREPPASREQGHGLLRAAALPLVPISAADGQMGGGSNARRRPAAHRAPRGEVALTPPTGPVFISLPGDVLDAEVELDFGKPTRVDARVRPSDRTSCATRGEAARLRAIR